VSAESRAAVRRIVQEKLASGGLVYISYNCMPGWASELPVQRLLVELASAARGDSAEKMRRAVELLAQMNGRGMRYFDSNPEAARAIESYARVPPNYLAHEFLNEDVAAVLFRRCDRRDGRSGLELSRQLRRSQTTTRCYSSRSPSPIR